MPKPRTTKDGLPIITEKTFGEVATTYPIASPDGDPAVRQRIKGENPQLYRILELGSKAAPTYEARSYYKMGIEIAYELLRTQSAVDGRK